MIGHKKSRNIHSAPHLSCCRALEVQKVICAPDAVQSQLPVTGYEKPILGWVLPEATLNRLESHSGL